jgi:hypothetical protein
MDMIDHLMASEKNENNKDSQKEQVTPKKKYFKKSKKYGNFLVTFKACGIF